jgi:hypothetical protein
MNYKLFVSLLFTVAINGMDSVIIDYNKGESLPDLNNQPCAVFGATPRFTVFEKSLEQLNADFSQLHQHHKRDKRLKNIHGTIKPIINRLVKSPGLDRVAHLIGTSDFEQQCKLFFATGLSDATLRENSNQLLTTVTDEKLPVLLHIFMPSYYADLSEDKKRSDRLATFLTHAAQLYQRAYQSVATDVKTFIVIPPLDHFISIKPESDPCLANLAVVQSIALSSATSSATLIDQNLEELKHMVQTLHKDGFTATRGVQLGLYNESGHATTIFNPYILNPEKSVPYKDSAFINEHFENYVSTACDQEAS